MKELEHGQKVIIKISKYQTVIFCPECNKKLDKIPKETILPNKLAMPIPPKCLGCGIEIEIRII